MTKQYLLQHERMLPCVYIKKPREGNREISNVISSSKGNQVNSSVTIEVIHLILSAGHQPLSQFNI